MCCIQILCDYHTRITHRRITPPRFGDTEYLWLNCDTLLLLWKFYFLRAPGKKDIKKDTSKHILIVSSHVNFQS